jgi:hypothetical protein
MLLGSEHQNIHGYPSNSEFRLREPKVRTTGKDRPSKQCGTAAGNETAECSHVTHFARPGLSRVSDMRCSCIHVHPSPGGVPEWFIAWPTYRKAAPFRPSGVAPLLEATDLLRTFESQSGGSANMRRLPLAATTRKKVALNTAAEK